MLMATRLQTCRTVWRSVLKDFSYGGDQHSVINKCTSNFGTSKYISTKCRSPGQILHPWTVCRQRNLEVKLEGITQATCSTNRFTSTAFKVSKRNGDTDCHGSGSADQMREVEKINIRLPWADRIPKLAFLLTNVFTIEECERYINISEQIGYENRTYPDANYLDSASATRCIWECKEAAAQLFEKIQPYLPKSWWPGTKLSSINCKLNFERYDKYEPSEARRDGTYTKANGDRSYLTFHIFLNDLQDDGFTSLVSPPMCQPTNESSDRRRARPLQKIKIQPRTGCVLVFQNDIFYESSEITTGTKYVLRGDIMYNMMGNNTGSKIDPIVEGFGDNQEPSTDAANILQQMAWSQSNTARTVQVQATKPSPKGIPFYVPEMNGFIYVQ